MNNDFAIESFIEYCDSMMIVNEGFNISQGIKKAIDWIVSHVKQLLKMIRESIANLKRGKVKPVEKETKTIENKKESNNEIKEKPTTKRIIIVDDYGQYTELMSYYPTLQKELTNTGNAIKSLFSSVSIYADKGNDSNNDYIEKINALHDTVNEVYDKVYEILSDDGRKRVDDPKQYPLENVIGFYNHLESCLKGCDTVIATIAHVPNDKPISNDGQRLIAESIKVLKKIYQIFYMCYMFASFLARK